MAIEIENLKLKDVVEIANPELAEEGEMMNQTTVDIIKGCKYQGEVTQIQDGLAYVGFKTDIGWVTQVFKPEELREVK